MSARIDELVLRVPGLAAGEAEALAREVAALLSERSEHLQAVELSRLHLRLPAVPRTELAQAIVTRICEAAL